MKNNWENLGEEIRRTVQDAIEKGNYDQLNQTVSNTVNQAAKTISKGAKKASDTVKQASVDYEKMLGEYREHARKRREANEEQRRAYEESHQNSTESRQRAKEVQRDNAGIGQDGWKSTKESRIKDDPTKSMVNIPSRIGPVLGTVFGYSFGILCLIGIWGNAILAGLAQRILGPAGAVLFQSIHVMIGVLSAAGFAAGITGQRRLGRIKRGRKYMVALDSRAYGNITNLASAAGRDKKKVIKDLEYMIRKKWLKEGHLDKDKTCLMITNQMYQEYLHLEKQKGIVRQEQMDQEAAIKEQQDRERAAREHLSPEVRSVIDEGENYVKKIRACNDAIPGEEISRKIDRIELVVDTIFDRVEQEPGCVTDIQKLMSYYLPTTIKLLEAYAEMDAQPVGGENIRNAKAEIEATLDTLNAAFEKILDSLFLDKAWDISTDISVLNTMLAKEGLKEDGLKKSGQDKE